MIGRRFISFLRRNPSSSSSSVKSGVEEEAKPKSWGRRVVSGGLICVTGGVALSALDDLVIYHGCSSKAMEKASKNQAVVEAIGEPIARGPWYNASLAVTHKRHSVSCTFPVSGPHGTGIFQLRAVRNGGTQSLRYFQLAVYFTLSVSISSYCPNLFVSAKFINNSYCCTTATKSSSNKRKIFQEKCAFGLR
ncbi:putative cytochrome c oxidase assembly factor 1 [Helianthus annuus]|nr:putative cytochrome c oxidase assembly factor 1 [Helianthus annuus]